MVTDAREFQVRRFAQDRMMRAGMAERALLAARLAGRLYRQGSTPIRACREAVRIASATLGGGGAA